jgi:N-acetyl-alpha-D-muramate 1-phosphate uridylyltransferase
MKSAVVLAGGLGTRLQNRTHDRLPKALVDVAGRPFLDWKIEELCVGGVEDIVILTGHLSEAIHSHVAQRWSRGDVRVRCVAEPTPLGTAGAIAGAARSLPPEFWVTYGDTLLDADMATIEAAWLAGSGSALMTLVENVDREQPSNVTLIDKRVAAYSKSDPPGSHRFLDYGLLIMSRSLFRNYSSGQFLNLDTVFRDLVEADDLEGLAVNGWFHDIGTPEALDETAKWLIERMASDPGEKRERYLGD